MKTEPKYQKQHKVSQVYLKQFGYKRDEEWWLSVYKAGNKITENIRINNFTTETNIFDLPYQDAELKRHFENQSSFIENHYPTIISNLHNQKRLTFKNKDVLNHFVANIMCRTNPFRSFIHDLLKYSDTRDKFINEMTMFSNDTKEIRIFLKKFKIEFQLNLAIGILMDHLVQVFRKFEKVVIRECEGKGWLTTDSPVYLDKQGRHEWIIPIESEIYLPLSKDFCLFMYHPNSVINTNPLRNLKIDRVNNVSMDTFDNITRKIVMDYDEYLIMNIEVEPTDVTKKILLSAANNRP